MEIIKNQLSQENEQLRQDQTISREWLHANVTPPVTPDPIKQTSSSLFDRPQAKMRDVTILKTSDKTRMVLKLKFSFINF